MGKLIIEQELSGLLLEALREIKELRTMIEDVHLLFRPRPVVKRLTKKQKTEIEIQKMMAEMTVDILTRG